MTSLTFMQKLKTGRYGFFYINQLVVGLSSFINSLFFLFFVFVFVFVFVVHGTAGSGYWSDYNKHVIRTVGKLIGYMPGGTIINVMKSWYEGLFMLAHEDIYIIHIQRHSMALLDTCSYYTHRSLLYYYYYYIIKLVIFSANVLLLQEARLSLCATHHLLPLRSGVHHLLRAFVLNSSQRSHQRWLSYGKQLTPQARPFPTHPSSKKIILSRTV